MQFLVNIDLNKNELQNAVIQPLATAPSNAKKGQIYFNTADNALYQYNGTAWVKVGVVYNQASSTGAVITGLSNTGSVTTTNLVDLTLTGYTPVTGGYVSAGATMQQAFSALDTAVKNAVAGGGEVNQDAWSYINVGGTTISASAKTDTFKITGSGSATVTGNASTKTVNVDVQVDVPTKTSDLKNDSGFISSIPSQYITETELNTALDDYVAKSGSTMSGALNMGNNKITNLSNGTNDGDAVNKKQLDDAIAGIGTVFDFKGSVATVANLPSTGNKVGDVYFVEEESVGYIWLTDTLSPQGRWEKFGEPIDLSGYLQKSELASTTGASTTTAMTQAAVTTALAGKANSGDVPAAVKFATGTIATSLSTITVNYTGTVINTFVKNASGEKVLTDVDINAGNVVFSCAANPSSALTCTVVYV